MVSDSWVTLYHGTDWESALDILNYGLDLGHLQRFQVGRMTQLGEGWYTTDSVDIAWYFASIAPGSVGNSYTVIEMRILWEHLETLLDQRLAIKSPINNVLFEGEQYWFHPDSFPVLNEQVVFHPYTGER